MSARSNMKIVLSGIVVFAASSISNDARSHTKPWIFGCLGYNSANGNCNHWNAPVTMARHPCGMSESERQAFNHAFNAWGQRLDGVDTMLSPGLVWPASNCTIALDDGWSSYAIVDPSFIPGLAGYTFNVIAGDHIVESDVVMIDGLNSNFDDINESVPMVGGSDGEAYGVIVHELGHAYGVGHAEDWLSFGSSQVSVMRSTWPLALVGTKTFTVPFEVSPLFWEARIVRALYPNGSDLNVMTSAQKVGGSGQAPVVANAPASDWFVGQCQSFVAEYTIINRGTQTVNVKHRFFMNQSASAHSVQGPYTFVASTRSVQFDSFVTGQHDIAPTQVPVGWYFLYHQVDYTNNLSESNEADNVVRLAGRVAVLPC